MRPLLVIAMLSLLLAGCGAETATVGQPTSTSASPTPTWPAKGCEEHSAAYIDYVSDANGADTREDAAAPYMQPADHLVREGPQPPHSPRGWVVVTPENEIRAVLTMTHGENGFLVDSVEKCAG